jgi:hypothetical protein
MTTKGAGVTALLALAAFAILSLAFGAPFLEARLPGGLPLGNVLAGLGPCAMAGAAVVLSVRGTVLRAASLASLVGAVLWLPASVVLAGNPELNFGGGRGSVWLALTVAVVGAAGGTLLWALVASVLAKVRGASAA